MADVDVSGFWPGWDVGPMLGQGAYGRVYLVSRERAGAREESALKVVTVPRDDSEVRAMAAQGMSPVEIAAELRARASRLEGEILAMRRLKAAANVVTIEDFHVSEPGPGGVRWEFCIRMELLESLPAYERRAGALGPRAAAAMCAEVCRALECCEAVGIIHRDVKPSNIFRDEFGGWRLGDFGIARQLSGGDGGAMTSIGTPLYEAPEVSLGLAYGPSVDTYSLGLVLYQHLDGGRLPFMGELTAAEAVSRRLREDGVPPIAGIDDGLQAVVARACRRDPSERYACAGDFRRDLAAWLAAHDNDTRTISETHNNDPGAGTSAPSDADLMAQVAAALTASRERIAVSRIDAPCPTFVPTPSSATTEADPTMYANELADTIGIWDMPKSPETCHTKDESKLHIHPSAQSCRVAPSASEARKAILADIVNALPTRPLEKSDAPHKSEALLGRTHGMRLDKGYVSPRMVTNANTMEAVLVKPYFMLIDEEVLGFPKLDSYFHEIRLQNASLLIVAKGFSEEAIDDLLRFKGQAKVNIAAIETPGYGDRRLRILEDISIFTGARDATQTLSRDYAVALSGDPIPLPSVTQLGRAEIAIVSGDCTVISGGAGSESEVRNRIAGIVRERMSTSSDYDRDKLRERETSLDAALASMPGRDLAARKAVEALIASFPGTPDLVEHNGGKDAPNLTHICLKLGMPAHEIPLFLYCPDVFFHRKGICGTVKAIYYVDYASKATGWWTWDEFCSLKIEATGQFSFRIGDNSFKAQPGAEIVVEALRTAQNTYREEI